MFWKFHGLTTLISDNFLISEEQAGFQKGYATVDNVFILHPLIRNCLDRTETSWHFVTLVAQEGE